MENKKIGRDEQGTLKPLVDNVMSEDLCPANSSDGEEYRLERLKALGTSPTEAKAMREEYYGAFAEMMEERRHYGHAGR